MAPLVYVTVHNNDALAVLDAATNAVVGTVTLSGPGSGAEDLAFNPTGTRAYVTNLYGGTVEVVDTRRAPGKVAASVAVPPAGQPHQLVWAAVSPTAQRAYVADTLQDQLAVIDTRTNKIAATVPVGPAFALAVNPAGTRVYVTNVDPNFNPGSVSVIDTATNAVVATVGVGVSPEAVAVNPAGTRVYVANLNDATFSVIGTAANAVLATVALGKCRGLAFNPAGTRLYATSDADAVLVIDTAANAVLAAVALPPGSFPVDVAVAPDGTRVFVANNAAGNVSVLDATVTPPAVVAMVPVGAYPTAVALKP